MRFIHTLFAVVSLLTVAVGQHRLTIDVNCDSQTQTDHEWTFEIQVEVAPGGDANTHTVQVNVAKHQKSDVIAKSLARKLTKATGIPCSAAETTNPIAGEETGTDVVLPNEITVKKARTRKRLNKERHPDGDPRTKWQQKDDHVKVYEGDKQLNKPTNTKIEHTRQSEIPL
ncbi:MAG: hypothetical protein KDC95_18485 [Planctomycetes bacterium]|nr:hypothetical protein [Planctomycetota bacterium]